MPKNSEKNQRNLKQDIEIAETRVEVRNIKERFEKFVDNEFPHFKDKVEKRFNWIIGLVILGVLIPILLYVLK